MLEVEWTSPALKDLRGIEQFLERERSPEYAVRLLTAIRSRAHWLIDFPRGGRPFLNETRILRVLETPYLIRYRVLEEAKRVQVLRVHHERQDWSIVS